jgi:hypothetical protein
MTIRRLIDWSRQASPPMPICASPMPISTARATLRQARRAAAANHDRERGNDRQQRDAAKRVIERADDRLRSCPDRKLGYRHVRPPALGRAGGGADADAQAAALDSLRVAVVADTVLAYVDLCGATRAANVSREIVAVQERSVGVVRDQLAAGEVSPLEVSQAASLLESTRATLAPFEAARANALYRIATLQGRPR